MATVLGWDWQYCGGSPLSILKKHQYKQVINLLLLLATEIRFVYYHGLNQSIQNDTKRMNIPGGASLGGSGPRHRVRKIHRGVDVPYLTILPVIIPASHTHTLLFVCLFVFIVTQGHFFTASGGAQREGETSMWERHINWLPPIPTLTRHWTHNLGMCLTGDWTSNLSVYRAVLQPTEPY